jgi:hypothetical protein
LNPNPHPERRRVRHPRNVLSEFIAQIDVKDRVCLKWD